MSNSKKDTLKLERMQSKVMSRRCEDQYRKHERGKKKQTGFYRSERFKKMKKP